MRASAIVYSPPGFVGAMEKIPAPPIAAKMASMRRGPGAGK
jgi:hypothetical protein